MTSKLKQERINKGLCPICGEQAAPYYLCDKCRGKAILRRFLNRAVEAGAFRMKKVGRENTYAIGDENADFSYRFPEKFDKRHEPRFRNIPVDVEKELLNIFLTKYLCQWC